jgi:membrane-bound lytic murein transglycosylase D
MQPRAVALLLSIVGIAACAHNPKLPPRPAAVDIDVEPFVVDPIDLIGEDFDPAPFLVSPTDAIPTSDAEAPAGLDLSGTTIPLEINPRVQFWLDVFTGRERSNFQRYLARQGRYEELIRTKLREADLPEELLYLALIESGFSPIARSHASAVGMWQFMAATARIEGLEVSEYVDERRHWELATDAAVRHLTRLHNQFGSWYLAAAAYNSGSGRVSRALRRRADGATGNDSLFWQIHDVLPRETRDYVPKLLAATIIGRNRGEFGFDDVMPFDPDSLDRALIPDATDLSVIADAAGVEEDDIYALNPHLPRRVTPPGREYEVFLPPGTLESFQVAYSEIPPDKRVRFLEHTVRRGETLSHIASQYGTSVRLIQETNGIRNANRLSIGQRLRIPRGTVTVRVASSGGPSASSSSDVRPIVDGRLEHRVRRGDTLWAIARRYGVTTQQLMAWNSLNARSVLHPGDVIVIRPRS